MHVSCSVHFLPPSHIGGKTFWEQHSHLWNHNHASYWKVMWGYWLYYPMHLHSAPHLPTFWYLKGSKKVLFLTWELRILTGLGQQNCDRFDGLTVQPADFNGFPRIGRFLEYSSFVVHPDQIVVRFLKHYQVCEIHTEIFSVPREYPNIYQAVPNREMKWSW